MHNYSISVSCGTMQWKKKTAWTKLCLNDQYFVWLTSSKVLLHIFNFIFDHLLCRLNADKMSQCTRAYAMNQAWDIRRRGKKKTRAVRFVSIESFQMQIKNQIKNEAKIVFYKCVLYERVTSTNRMRHKVWWSLDGCSLSHCLMFISFETGKNAVFDAIEVSENERQYFFSTPFYFAWTTEIATSKINPLTFCDDKNKNRIEKINEKKWQTKFDSHETMRSSVIGHLFDRRSVRLRFDHRSTRVSLATAIDISYSNNIFSVNFFSIFFFSFIHFDRQCIG